MSDNLSPIQTAPYGTWDSPITPELIVSDSISIDEVRILNGVTYWIEKRPKEQGRCVLVARDEHGIRELTPPPYSVRSRVNEYGGGSYTASAVGVFFVDNKDQQIYRHHDGEITRVTNYTGCRFADFVVIGDQGRLVCVCEDHTDAEREPINTLVSIDIRNGHLHVLRRGCDFYSNPVYHDGRLAWLCWNHPNMPWDGTELWIAQLEQDEILHAEQIAGASTISICQPRWSPDGVLTYISDESGWSNLYQRILGKQHALLPMRSDFGSPQWVFGQSDYDFLGRDHIIARHKVDGYDQLMELNVHNSKSRTIETDYRSISSICCGPDSCTFIASTANEPSAVIERDVVQADNIILKRTSAIELDVDQVSVAQPLCFESRHGDDVHAFYYTPTNPSFRSDGAPPCIILSHGGPTACTDMGFDIRKQFWTSRGFAIIDVNYSGSAGFGRAYRERLNGRWGIRDVEDCCDAASYAVDTGFADANSLLIKGGSAGGYAVLCALTFHDVFSAGASYYGIGDLETLATDTHKFESRYLDKLVGPYPSQRATYRQRSPIHHVDRLAVPVIFFQGEDDHVVPKQQAETMVEAIRNKGLPVAYALFEGEGHGFRRAETIEHTLLSELYFYQCVLGLREPAPDGPIRIANL